MMMISIKACPRYTQFEFPHYRYFPGENARPAEDSLSLPRGEDWRGNDQYLFGIDLYNHGYWWEAHEALESLWQKAPRGHVSREYLQGLIKLAGAFLKWRARNQKGLDYLFAGALRHLSNVGKEYPVYMGLNIADYTERLKKHFKPVMGEQRWTDPCADYPYIVLAFPEKHAGVRTGVIKANKELLTKEEKDDLRYMLRAEYEGYGVVSA